MGDRNELEADAGRLERLVRGLAGGHEHLRAAMRPRHLEVLRAGRHFPGEGLGRAAPALGLAAVLVHGRGHVVDHGDLVRARLCQRHVEGAAEFPRRGVLRLHRRPVRRGDRQVVEPHRIVLEVEQVVRDRRVHRHPQIAAGQDGGRGQHPGPVGLDRQGKAQDDGERVRRRARGRTSCASSLSVSCEEPHGLRLSVTAPSSCSPETFAVAGGLGRPLKRQAQQLAPADFSRGLDDELVLAGGQRLRAGTCRCSR